MSNGMFSQEFDVRQSAEESREVAKQLLLKYNKELVFILPSHIHTIWKDFEKDMRHAAKSESFNPDTLEMNQFCNENYVDLWKIYPFDISHWYANWYMTYLEARDIKLKISELTYRYWWSLFTEVEHPQPFYSFINGLFKVQRRIERETLKEFYWNDLEWKSKILKMELPDIDFEILNPMHLYDYIRKKQSAENLKIAKRQVREKGDVTDMSAFDVKYKPRKMEFKVDDFVEHEEEGPGIVVKSGYGFDGETVTVCFYNGLMTEIDIRELKPCSQQMSKEPSLKK